ncbi:hypothetical protein BpHYR1_031263 [Brachionus plicatilis]|uniref:Uncharacterized protein n=1 Tax=Brachionus plicatilis TaxID=10195 RepID=A0A3M7T7M7_BRAPC|nr:hypothetical protein BpHYR1_031263 [Brachionus plicatilis]
MNPIDIESEEETSSSTTVIRRHHDQDTDDTDNNILDLGIEKNHKRGRRKRSALALQKNSFGPLNPALINNTVPSTSTALQVTNEPAPKKPGRPRKVVETQTPALETQAKKRGRPKKNLP